MALETKEMISSKAPMPPIMKLLSIAVVSLFSLSLNAEAVKVSDKCAAKWASSE